MIEVFSGGLTKYTCAYICGACMPKDFHNYSLYDLHIFLLLHTSEYLSPRCRPHKAFRCTGQITPWAKPIGRVWSRILSGSFCPRTQNAHFQIQQRVHPQRLLKKHLQRIKTFSAYMYTVCTVANRIQTSLGVIVVVPLRHRQSLPVDRLRKPSVYWRAWV